MGGVSSMSATRKAEALSTFDGRCAITKNNVVDS